MKRKLIWAISNGLFVWLVSKARAKGRTIPAIGSVALKSWNGTEWVDIPDVNKTLAD